MNKAYNKITWQNKPSTATPLNQTNLNEMSNALDTIDDRVIALDSGKVSSVTVTNTLPTGDTIATITVDGTATNIKSAQVVVDDTPSATSENPLQNKAIYEMLNNLLPEETAEGNPISITDASGLNAKSCSVDLLPIQDLSQGDPSPTNICPISGRTEVSVTRTGKNLYDKSRTFPYFYGYMANNDTCVENGAHFITYIEVLPNTYYTVSRPRFAENERLGLALSNELPSDGSPIFNRVMATQSGTVGSIMSLTRNSQNFKYLIIWAGWKDSGVDNVNNSLQIELGSTATAYEPYQGETHTETLGQTVYGGKVDFVEGELSNEWGYIASYNGETLPEEWISDRDVYAPNTTPTNGAEVAYKLATPTEITLTAEQISLLKGNNVVSTDGDNIILKYSADIGLYIAGQLQS